MADGTMLVTGQKVITPRGEGTVAEVTGETEKVNLSNGETESFELDELEDDSSAG